MPKIQLPIANGFYSSESLPISAQRCINWYPNIVQTQGLSQETLFGIPGIRQLVTTGLLEQNRGIHVMAGILYFVNGNSLYRLNRTVGPPEAFDFTSLGTITGDGPVSMADNGVQLMILVPGGLGSIWVQNTLTFTPDINAVDPDFTASGAPQLVVFINSFFVCNTEDKKFISCTPNNGLDWIATDFGTAEADPDIIRAPFVFKNILYMLGSETIQAFRVVPAGAGFPFASVVDFIIPKGIFSPFSIVNANNSFMFIGGGVNESPAVWLFTGNGVEKISTTAIDNLLNGFTDAEIAGVIGVSYAEKGAYFAGFSLPDRDIYYDTISGRWHERNTFVDGQLTGWRVGFMATAYGRVIVGDSIDGRIGELDSTLYTEYGDTIFRRIRIQPLTNMGNNIFVKAMELTMESGVGDFVTRDPQIRRRISDNAKTYGNETTRDIGRQGEFEKRAVWRREGRVPNFRVYEFTMTDPVNPTVIKLVADLAGSSRG